MATRTCPDCATEVGAADLICFTCGANLPRIRSADDPPLPITVAQKAVSADKAGRRISSAVLRITFPAGNVEVPAGTSVLLGRDPAESLVAAAFDQCENVSRRHALDHRRRRRARHDQGRALDERHVRQQRPAAARHRRPAGRRRHGPAGRRRHRPRDRLLH